MEDNEVILTSQNGNIQEQGSLEQNIFFFSLKDFWLFHLFKSD